LREIYFLLHKAVFCLGEQDKKNNVNILDVTF